MMRQYAGHTLLLVAIALLSACVNLNAPDLIFINGKIVTVDEEFSIVESLAVDDGRIAMLGRNRDVMRIRDRGTTVVDLQGKMVLPGLIDSHMHPISASVSEADHSVPNISTIDELLNYVAARAVAMPPTEWIWVTDVFSTRLKELRLPTREELDAVAPHHAVVFMSFPSSPLSVLNTTAMGLLGIDAEFAAQHAEDIERRSLTGKPTGVIRHLSRYLTQSPPIATPETIELQQEHLLEMLGTYNSVGLTTVSDRNALSDDVKLYQSLNVTNSLTARIRLLHSLDTSSSRALTDIRDDIQRIAAHPLRQSDSMLQLLGIKIKIDGGILTGTALMEEPWGVEKFHAISDPEYRGRLLVSNDRLLATIRDAVQAGLQIAGHSVGDGAVETLLAALEEVNQSDAIEATRPVIVHGNFISDDAVARMSDISVLVDVQPAWLFLDGNMLLEQFGYERLANFQPLRDLFASGVVAGGGSDHWFKLDSHGATNPFNPFLGMWVAITRNARFLDREMHPEQSLTREQAIRLYTANNAYLLFMEDQTGTLEEDKFADMIVIDRDLLTCDIDDLKDTRVLQTYLSGELVYNVDVQER